MTEARAADHSARLSDRLLTERVQAGTALGFKVRAAFLGIAFCVSLVVNQDHGDRILSSAAFVLLVAVNFWLYDRVERQNWVKPATRIAVALDIALAAALPWMWYATTPVETAPAYLVKTGLVVVSHFLIVLNALCLRPAIPMTAGLGMVGVYLSYILYAAQDPRTEFTQSYLRSGLGPAIHTDHIVTICATYLGSGLVLMLLLMGIRRLVTESARQEATNRTMQRYFSPKVAAQLAEDRPDALSIGGQQQDVVVMFTDIRGFTAYAETHPAEQVVEELCAYHNAMVEAVFAHGGTLDKFLGDGMMVMFGVPDPTPDDADRALAAAKAMRTNLYWLNKVRAREGKPIWAHGIGLHAGPAVVGNVGSAQRLDFTAIGDTVNVASRVQAATVNVGADILMTDAVVARLSKPPVLTPLAPLHLRGRAAPMPVHALPPPTDRATG